MLKDSYLLQIYVLPKHGGMVTNSNTFLTMILFVYVTGFVCFVC